MFGYVSIYKDELKVKEYNDFRSYYCGLCKSLGKKHNQLVRLGLNYDFTFMAILLDSIYDDKTEFDNIGCIKSISKKKTVINNRFIDFSCDMSIILTYYKLLDDIKDEKSIKAFFACIPYYFSVKKIKSKYKDIITKIKNNLSLLSRLERDGCSSKDEAAHPFAQIMADIFECANSSLKLIGYNLGRYIFFADALDDMDSDLKCGNYNIFNNAYSYNGTMDNNTKKDIEQSMLLTLSYVADEYEKLPKFKNKEILDNIIYIGIRAKFEYLLSKVGSCDKKGRKIK